MLQLFRKQNGWRPGVQWVNLGCDFEISRAARASIHADGVVFLQLDTGILFQSNRIGARIWAGLERRENLQDIVIRIGREYGVPAVHVEHDAKEFLAELEVAGFLSRV